MTEPQIHLEPSGTCESQTDDAVGSKVGADRAVAERATPQRTLVIPLNCPDDYYCRVIGSLRAVRAAARQAYAVLFTAQAAGATIKTDADGDVTVTPDNVRAKAILAAALNQDGKAPCYQMRRYVLDTLCPTIRSFVFDDLRRRVWSRWQARDPEFPRAGMGWLALQNVRGLAVFRNSGIGFPAAVMGSDALADHALSLSWDREIGPVTFKIPKMDPGRWHRWRRIVSGDIDHGTLTLNERDGKLTATVAYQAPTVSAGLDTDRLMVVRINAAADGLTFVGPDGATTLDGISFADASEWAKELLCQREKWERRRAAVGNPRKPWGEPRRFHAIAEHQRRVTRHRENGVQHRNHAWSKRIATRAMDWRCGRVEIEIAADATLRGHSWGWHHLELVCGYKLRAIGAKLTRTEPPSSLKTE